MTPAALSGARARDRPHQATKRYVALVHKDKNIIAYRSYTSYQVEPTQAEERAIIKALVDYPFDSIAR